MHTHHSHHHDHDVDWAARAADITREGEVLMPYLVETVSWLVTLCRDEGLEVRRIVDLGCGPGVGTCVLAQQFDSAVVVGVDSSQEMLDHATVRAETLGLSGRIRTQRADLPDGLDAVDGADLVWMAMVLHHIDDQTATLRRIRSLLASGGMLAIAEFGNPMRFLPDDIAADRPGLARWFGEFNPADVFPAVDGPVLFEATGFQLVAERMVRVRLDPPLSEQARRVVLGYLGRMRHLAEERLDTQDRRTLDLLMDEQSPLGIMRRPDMFLDASRRIYVARVPRG